ncbi:MAG: SH3 domain-containing protein, partial [Lachnospiraceae bacterium]|nr:SH3 domain-containing protein [Lachnospiraceae bacterium]
MTFKKFLFAGVTVYLLSSQVIATQAADMSMNSLVGNVGIAAVTNEVLDKEKYIEYVNNAIGASWGYDELGIAIVEEGNLNVREAASTSAKVVGKMYNNAACEILDEADGWYHITSGEVEGYVSSEFIVTGIQAKMLGLELAYER